MSDIDGTLEMQSRTAEVGRNTGAPMRRRDRRGMAMAAVPVLVLGLAGIGVAAETSLRAAGNIASGPAVATCTTGVIGDVTGDDIVNIIDAQQIARATVGLSVSSTVEGRLSSHGDVTDDGATNIIDAQQIARWVVGLSTAFPIGEPCSGGGGSGTLEAQNTTSGSHPPEPYTVTLNGDTQDMPADGSYTFTGVPAGDHDVTVGNLQGCTVSGSTTLTVSVPSGGLGQAHWNISC